jgi:hypothetical protein
MQRIEKGTTLAQITWPQTWLPSLNTSDIPASYKDGDIVPAVVGRGGGNCPNCGDPDGLMYCFRIDYGVNTIHWFEGRKLKCSLETALCPVCAEGGLLDALRLSSGLRHLVMNGKPAIDIDLERQSPVLGQERAWKEAVGIIENLPTIGKWLWLVGAYGTGKTHILCGLVNAALRLGVEARYITGAHLMDKIRGAILEDRVPEEIENWTKLPFLAIDELDRVNWTEFTGERIFQVLDDRYSLGKPCWLACNATPQEIANHETLAAILSRTTKAGVIPLTCVDQRKR